MASVFHDFAPVYREQGLAVIPCVPGDKYPGKFAGGQWYAANDWAKYCDRLPTDFESQIWDRWPDAGVCLALGTSSAPAGKILVAVDIDTDDSAEVAAIKSVLPGSPVAKRGRKGETQFYLANPCVTNRPYNDAHKRRLLDLLAHGRQTVLPPTIHPDTGQAYHWTTPDTLEAFDVSELPMLPDDIADRLAEALKPFGYAPPPALLVGPAGSADLGTDTPHRALNDAALANLDAWVPALNLYGLTRAGGHYRAVAAWRGSANGRPLSQRKPNLSIDSSGIRDFGDADKGYTPLDLVMAAIDGCDLDMAFRWLQEKVAPSAPILLVSSGPKVGADPEPEPQVEEAPRGNLAGLRLATYNGEALADATLGADREAQLPAVIEERQALEAVASIGSDDADFGVIPAHLCAPPGLLGEVVEWINASSRNVVPQHALGAAVTLLGAVMGRRWEGPTRLRTNFYCLNVAGSGFGKEHPLDACRTLALGAGLDNFLGAEETKSDSALRKLLEAYPSRVLFMDEFGGFMRKILARNAPAHEARTRDLLLTFFSRAKGDYLGSEGASERAVKIANPNLNICGSTTPSDLWSAFSSASTADGLLPRFLVFDAGDKRPEAVTPALDVSDPPRSLMRKLHGLLDIRPIGNIASATNGKIQPIRATWGEGAQDHFEALAREMLEAGDADLEKAPIFSRVAEHVLKLALVYAVGIAPARPTIDLAALSWAEAIVETSTAALLKAIEGRVADNDDQAAYLDVLNRITAAGPYGMLESQLGKRLRGKYNKRRFDDIVGQLLHANEIWREATSGPSGVGRMGVRVGRKVEVEEAS